MFNLYKFNNCCSEQQQQTAKLPQSRSKTMTARERLTPGLDQLRLYCAVCEVLLPGLKDRAGPESLPQAVQSRSLRAVEKTLKKPAGAVAACLKKLEGHFGGTSLITHAER